MGPRFRTPCAEDMLEKNPGLNFLAHLVRIRPQNTFDSVLKKAKDLNNKRT
jgi:hypothetical protein